MSEKSIILVGNPDSGKSNFLIRLWLGLASRKFNLFTKSAPDDIKYVEEMAAHILQGRFVPRTDKDDQERDLKITVTSRENDKGASIFIPDVTGEIWRSAVETFEISDRWMAMLKSSSAALLFVRVLSDLNVQPLDWVNSQKYLKAGLGEEKDKTMIPTQVSLIELLRFLEETLDANSIDQPKVAIIVTAWDLLNVEEAVLGPEVYLQKEYPMFAGRLLDTKKLNIKVFGSSIVGGDFILEEFVQKYRAGDPDKAGFIVSKDENNNWKIINDITAPINWLLE